MLNQRVPILVYHHVYSDEVMAKLQPAPGVIGESEFRRQLQYIDHTGSTIVSTSQILNWLLDEIPLPSRAVALHFDNGWLDTCAVVMPILKQMGMIATCYVITDGLEAASQGKSHAVRTLTEGVVDHPFMTWRHAHQLVDAGWEIGAHTATHCKMADKHHADGDQGVLEEVDVSNRIIDKRLGIVPQHFAYPSGSHNDRTDELLAPHYRSLRLWRFDWPIVWQWTDRFTSRLAIECQNIDARVPFSRFKHVFTDTSRDIPLHGV